MGLEFQREIVINGRCFYNEILIIDNWHTENGDKEIEDTDRGFRDEYPETWVGPEVTSNDHIEMNN